MWTTWNDLDRVFRASNQMRNRMNRVFAEFEGSCGYAEREGGKNNLPRTNIYDNGGHFEIKAGVPGLSKEEINVKIQGNYLEVSGVRKPDAPEGYSNHRTERGAVSFSRSFTLGADVDAAKVKASLENGILTLILPKSEAAKPKKIEIH